MKRRRAKKGTLRNNAQSPNPASRAAEFPRKTLAEHIELPRPVGATMETTEKTTLAKEIKVRRSEVQSGIKKRRRALPADEVVGAWVDYVTGGSNHDGEKIDQVLVRDSNYVIYLQSGRIIPEGDAGVLKLSDAISPLIGRIGSLLPENQVVTQAVNTQIARAYDLCFSGSLESAKAVLSAVLEKLEGSHIAMARLHYLWAGIAASTVGWLLILGAFVSGLVSDDRLIWFQAIGVGGTGGFFAIALSQNSLPIDLSHSTLVHWTSGIARILVAMAASIVCLLAVKGGIFMGVAEKVGNGFPELFFCFLAGFSETFVQRILRDNERKPDEANIPVVIGETSGRNKRAGR